MDTQTRAPWIGTTLLHNPRCAVHATVALIYGLLYPQRKAHRLVALVYTGPWAHEHPRTQKHILRPPEGQRTQAKGTTIRPFLGRRAHHTPAFWSLRGHGEREEQGATKPTSSPQAFPEPRRPFSTHTYPTIPNPPHTYSRNLFSCQPLALITTLVGKEI